jgi:hypothetical protein
MDPIWGNYRRWNNITGWLMFLVSAVVYLLTVEPTVSFWDCGEFILSAFRLQVGHPPGAPLFLMMSRVATLFAGGDVSKVALMVNILSAICSAFAIMFLFWTITHLVRRYLLLQHLLNQRTFPQLSEAELLELLLIHFQTPFGFQQLRGSFMLFPLLF